MEEINFKIVDDEGELASTLEVRRYIFVTEQGISEDLVFNGGDNEAMHITVTRGGDIIGTARVRFLNSGEAKLERMGVLPAYRSMGTGRKMVAFLIETLRKKRIEKLVLHAQYDVMDFYQRCGFSVVGLPFMEVGIKHVKMERKL